MWTYIKCEDGASKTSIRFAESALAMEHSKYVVYALRLHTDDWPCVFLIQWKAAPTKIVDPALEYQLWETPAEYRKSETNTKNEDLLAEIPRPQSRTQQTPYNMPVCANSVTYKYVCAWSWDPWISRRNTYIRTRGKHHPDFLDNSRVSPLNTSCLFQNLELGSFLSRTELFLDFPSL